MDNLIKSLKSVVDKNFNLIVIVIAIAMLGFVVKMVLDKKEAFSEYAEFIPVDLKASAPCENCPDCGGAKISPMEIAQN